MENIVGGKVMKSRGLDEMDETFVDFNQGNDVGEVRCAKWVKSGGRVGVDWGVESDVNSPVKSRVNDGSSRLYPLRSMGWSHWVKSGVLYETERAA